MSGLDSAVVARTMTDDPDQGKNKPTKSGTPAERRAEAFRQYGLILAPVIIAILAGMLALYHRSLDLENAVIQQRAALEWSTRLWPQITRHIEIATWSTAIVILVAVPLGILLTRPALRRITPAVITVANSGQAIPAYGLLVAGLIIAGKGKVTVIGALAVFALLPVLRNTMVGLDGVDKNVIEAGRGMGMTKMQALTKIELPLSVPVILAGVRTAIVLNIGMATLAFLIGGGALGVVINSGLKNSQTPVLIVGAGLVAIVALTFDWLGALAERYLKPRGI